VDTQILQKTAQEMVVKGILAMDESSGTMKKRFDEVGVEDSLENRNAYRMMLVGTEGLGKFVSGAILFDETIRQKEIVSALEEQGIVVGIKVDTGAKDMALFPGEKITEGLDGLRERLAEYKGIRCAFCKVARSYWCWSF
jgi:fructose-bisphosphate aldolase, class I